jgi:hypothetical protein
MKKNRFKSWLIKTLRKWLDKFEAGYNTVNVTHTIVPCITVEASVAVSKDRCPFYNDEFVRDVLAKKLGEEVINYANFDYCEKVNMEMFDKQIVYRATVRVAAEKRG